MSLSLSIFQKLCPDCASSVAISAARCDCGHNFESATHNLSPLEATLRDEELYEGYLAARAEQARQTARRAAEALAENMSNAELVSACALAREVAKSINSDLAEQQTKIAALRNALRNLKPVAPVVSPAATKPSTVTEKSASRRPSVAPSAPAHPKPAAIASPAPVELEKTPLVTAPAKPASAPVWHATTTQKAAGVLPPSRLPKPGKPSPVPSRPRQQLKRNKCLCRIPPALTARLPICFPKRAGFQGGKDYGDTQDDRWQGMSKLHVERASEYHTLPMRLCIYLGQYRTTLSYALHGRFHCPAQQLQT